MSATHVYRDPTTTFATIHSGAVDPSTGQVLFALTLGDKNSMSRSVACGGEQTEEY